MGGISPRARFVTLFIVASFCITSVGPCEFLPDDEGIHLLATPTAVAVQQPPTDAPTASPATQVAVLLTDTPVPVTPTPTVGTASISGFFSYPSEGGYPSLTVFVRNTDSGELIDAEYAACPLYGDCGGFEITVPAPAQYVLFAVLNEDSECNGAYTDRSGSLLPISVRPGDNIAKIDIGFCFFGIPEYIPAHTAATSISGTCPGAPPTRLSIGMRAYVSFDPPDPNRVRTQPSRSADIVGDMMPGTKMTILDGPGCASNWVWWKVRSDDGLVGWTAEGDQSAYWLVPIAGGAEPTVASSNPMKLWVETVDGCKVTVNGVLLGEQGPWSWEWGDGNGNTGWFPQEHTYSASGTYVVRVASASGTANSLSVTVDCPSGTVSSSYDEAQVRYILADAQLGNVIGYYRSFLDQPAVAEAVRRWDAGVRVTNISQFERKIVGDKGWQVVYAGTDTLINGMDVQLSTDAAPATGLILTIVNDSFRHVVKVTVKNFDTDAYIGEATARYDGAGKDGTILLPSPGNYRIIAESLFYPVHHESVVYFGGDCILHFDPATISGSAGNCQIVQP